MTCDIRYDSPMMTELATFPPLFWFSLAVCMAVIATYRLAGRTSRSTPLRVVFWTFAVIFVPTLAVIVMIAALLRQYGCDIAYVTAWTNPFGRLPQILAVSGIAVLVTGVALLARNHHTRIKEKS